MWLVIALLPLGCHKDEPAGRTIADPGRVTLRRLTRAEYDNTVRDLFLTTQRPASAFPADDFGLGFSRLAESLSVSAAHVDQYVLAAEGLVDEISSTRTVPVQALRVEAELGDGAGIPSSDGMRNLWLPGEVTLPFDTPSTGTWTLTVLGSSLGGGVLTVSVDGAELPAASLGAPADVVLSAGSHLVSLSLANPEPEALDIPMLSLDAIELTGPHGAPLAPGPGRDRVLFCDPTDSSEALCAQDIVRTFTRRAWRRPPTVEELDGLLGLYGNARAEGEDWESAVLVALQAVLIAPWFTYIVEVDPDPTSLEPRPLNGYEVATRLSYFLWSSTPDDELLELAEFGLLADTEVIRGQVERMLADPRARSLVETLATEWLYLDLVEEASPDPATFPAFDEGLRAAMKEELHLFAANVLLTDRSMLELVNGTETFVDARLARHYGIGEPSAAGFAAVNLDDRAGIVGRAGWLTALSYPTRTSPVRRGKWVVENLLCIDLDDPPPNVQPLAEEPPDDGTTPSMREQLEAHRADPMCASCHTVMDGVGFGLENYDGIGTWREHDEYDNPIDTVATLPNPESPLEPGRPFEGPSQMSELLAEEPALADCMARKVFSFALGRVPRDARITPNDDPFLDTIEAEFRDSDFRFSALAAAIATSDAFRYRTGEPEVAVEPEVTP